MLGELLYEEKGKTIGLRVLSSDDGGTTVEVTLETEGKILGVGEKSLWTYWSKTRPDGTIYGEGKGVMTTKDGDVIQLVGNGAAKAAGADGSIHYRGAIYFHTASQKFAKLNGTTAVHEYDVDGQGNTVAKVWEWK
ncbi:MAG TPA: hypothetical protein VEK15_08585 [Vicinamibacteria bacterium]|nr:hypothetical protein [Vicinamibacteria bacterium]